MTIVQTMRIALGTTVAAAGILMAGCGGASAVNDHARPVHAPRDKVTHAPSYAAVCDWTPAGPFGVTLVPSNCVMTPVKGHHVADGRTIR